MVIVIVETNLANGNDLCAAAVFGNAFAELITPAIGFVRMDSLCAPNLIVIGGDAAHRIEVVC